MTEREQVLREVLEVVEEQRQMYFHLDNIERFTAVNTICHYLRHELGIEWE